MIHFPISGVETYWWLPVAVAFAISTVASTGGVSGAILILPFQISVLGFFGPAVSPTNLLYNIVATPSGVYRYVRERRMVWPLAWVIVTGTVPGILLGAIVRVLYLPDPHHFKLFAAAVLAYVGLRLLMDALRKGAPKKEVSARFEVTDLSFSITTIAYRFNGADYRIVLWKVVLLSLIVGMVGGIYGIGGGAIMAPFLVALFALPVHSIAGVTLFGTFISSISGVLSYALISRFYSHSGLLISPDWALGLLFGVGGALGMYVGARLQRFIPARVIKVVLCAILLIVSAEYVREFFK